MADTAISALSALGAQPASTDLIPLVDVSDTTMSGNGTTKNVTYAYLTTGLLTDITGEAIGSLSDVTITTVADNEVLAYDSTAVGWVNQTAAEAGLAAASHTHVEADITDLGAYLTDITAESLGDLSDVTITTGAQGDILYYNGSAWVNLAPGTSGYFLKTQGAAANPTWDAIPGGGDMLAATYDADTDGVVDASEGVTFVARKASVGTITKGTPVYIVSYNVAGYIEVEAADADDAAKMPAVGVVTADMTNSADGYVLGLGQLDDIDTSSYGVGDDLYVSTATGLTSTKPTGDAEAIQKIAEVGRSHAVNGMIIVFGAGRSNDVSNKIDQKTLVLKQGAAPAPTAEGDIQWDTDDNRIAVGDGVGTVTFSNDTTNASTYAAASHAHAASDITSGTLAHERGGIEADISAVTTGDILAGTGAGTIGIVAAAGKSDGDVLTLQADGTVAYETPVGGSGGGPRGFTYVVAASNSRDATGADATCDGTADNVEIQAAIDAVSTAGGGIVQLLDGTYEIDAVINLKSGVTLSGNGYGTVLTRSDATDFLSVAVSTTVTEATVENILFDGNAQAAELFDHNGYLTNSTFRNIWALDFTGTNLFDVNQNSPNNTYQGIVCENCYGFGSDFYRSLISDVQFNLKTQITSGGTFIGQIRDGSILTNSRINLENVLGTIDLYGDNNTYAMPIVSNNFFLGLEHTGYLLSLDGSSSVIGNSFFPLTSTSWTGAAIYCNHSTGSVIVSNNNIFKYSSTNGYGVGGANNTGFATITGNVIHGGQGIFYDAGTGYTATISNNTIYSKSIISVQIEGAVRFTNNGIWNAATNGRAIQISDDKPGILVSGNRFRAQDSSVIPIYWNTTNKMSSAFSYILRDNYWENFTAVETNGSGVFETRVEDIVNGTGGASADGQVVIRSYDATNNRMEFNTTTTEGDSRVLGVCIEASADNIIAKVVTRGPVDNLKVNGVDDIAEGDELSTFSDAGVAQKAHSGHWVFAIALEGYITDDSNGVIDAILIEPYLKA